MLLTGTVTAKATIGSKAHSASQTGERMVSKAPWDSA
jgi:hypothetical protein